MQQYTRVSSRLNRLVAQRFGGGHHHQVVPSLNLTQNWVARGRFASIEGLDDQNYHPVEEHDDPYAHLIGKPILSWERFYFTDAHFHPDDHEDLMNQPHGYLTNDDPMDTRSGYDSVLVELLIISTVALTFGYVYGVHGVGHRSQGELLYNDSVTAELLEDKMRQIRIENHALVTRRDALKEQLEQN